MPKLQEDRLKQIAEKYARQGKLKKHKGDTLEKAKNRFVYGIMANQGKKRK